MRIPLPSLPQPRCVAYVLAALAHFPVTASLLHHYRLDETFQHETVVDTAGGSDATRTPMFLGSKGVISGAYQFSEVEGDAINLGASNAVLPTGPFTVTMWVRFSAEGGDENERLFDFSNGDAFSQMTSGVNFKIQGGWLRAFVGDGANKLATATPGKSLANETWYLMALRHLPSTNPGVVSDGSVQLTAIERSGGLLGAAEVTAETMTSAHQVGAVASATEFFLGASPTGVTELKAFDGLMDEVRIYDAVLSDQELAELHNEQVAASSSLRWIFNIDGDDEGWTGSGLASLTTSGGNLVATSAGADPVIFSPDNLGLDLTGIGKVFIKAKNPTALTNGTIFFATDDNPTFPGNSVGFSLTANDPGFTTYEIEMSSHPNWGGTLKRLRIDLPDGQSADAEILFDRIAVGESGNRPNVIVMMADDLGWRDVTVNGSTYYQTPNVERLAAAGVNYPNGFAANPLCSPTRAAVLTGLYPARVRFNTPNGHTDTVTLDPGVPATASPDLPATSVGSRTRLPNGYVTYADLLKGVGYSTSFLGKWHLGKDEYVPENQGFDLVVGGREHSGPPGGYFAPFSATSNIPTTLPDGSPVTDGMHINDILAMWAADFIEQNRNQPFLINMWWYDVHGPFQAKPEVRAKYVGLSDAEGRQNSPTMAAMVEVMDDGIGVVIDKLEELGLDDDTIIFFTGDNGGWMYSWLDEDLAVPTDNFPSRAGKACIWDGGTHVPFIVTWPGEVTGGTTNDDLVNNMDIYSTILEMTGVEAYDGYPLDSISLVPSLLGQAPANGEVIYNQFPQSPPATGTFPGVWVRQGDLKLIRFFHGNGAPDDHRYELYNIALDPSEENNLADQNPTVVTAMDALISQHLRDTDALVPVFNPNYVVPTYDNWTRNNGVRVLDGANGAIVMMSNSSLPALDSPDLSALATPAKVRIEMTSRSYGDGRIWWKLAAADDWTLANSASFPVTHDNVARIIEVPISPGAPVAQIRYQPSSGYFQTDVISIAVLDAADQVIELMSRRDSDGDGKVDDEELRTFRNPNGADDFAFEFNTADDFEDWSLSNSLDNLASGTSVGGLTTSADPQLSRLGFSFAGDAVPAIFVKFRASADADFQIFWGREGADNFAAARRLDIAYTGAGDWEYLEVPTSTSPLAAEWNGQTITRLRLDPIAAAAATWELDWIRGTDGDQDNDGMTDAAEGFPARDSDGDGLEDWADKDSDNDGAPDFAENRASRDPYGVQEMDLDADEDSYSDLFELIAGTDPDDAASEIGLSFAVVTRPAVRQVSFSFMGKASRSYRLLRSETLQGSWTAVASADAAADGALVLTDMTGSEKAFYRLEVSWNY